MRRKMPYGYEIRDGNYVISEPMAENVRSIYQLYLNGQSYSGISKMLVQSEDGISTGLNASWRMSVTWATIDGLL